MPNLIPELLINFKVYLDDVDLIGVADLELPGLEHMAETLAGSGIAGEIDSPVMGHLQKMAVKLKFRTLVGSLISLAAPKAHLLTARGSHQAYNAGDGAFEPYGSKVVMVGLPKKSALGKMESGKKGDNEVELEIIYLKVALAGQQIFEVDKLNFVYRIGETDYLSRVREQLGVESAGGLLGGGGGGFFQEIGKQAIGLVVSKAGSLANSLMGAAMGG